MPEASDKFFKEEMNKQNKVNVGGFTVPMPEADVVFLRAQKNSEHFHCFRRCIKAYRDFAVSRLAVVEPEKLLLAQGELRGLNAALNLLEHASTEFDVKG